MTTTPVESAPSASPPRSVLVTGGSGAFGQRFVQFLLTQPVARICVFSRSEATQAAMRDRLTDPRLRFFIGDVRDKDRLTRAMQGVEAVVHAAALKRVEVAEYDADECAKTNVLGTMNVIHAATTAGVARVVTLSTDKAANAVNAYGASKLMAEKLTLAAQQSRGATGPIFAATRYGNVSGSTGSVIPTWQKLIATGQPITVTASDATRFWMTLDESCALVWWTLQHMRGGELVVPSLSAYRVGDLAVAMGGTVTVSGMRPGEKVHETMIGPDEVALFRRHGPYWTTRGAGEMLSGPLTSDTAPRLTVEQLRGML